MRDKEVTTIQKIVESGVAQLANQPTIGLFYLREHVLSGTPELLQDHRTIDTFTRDLQGARQDAQYATESMASLKSVCAGPLLAVEEQVNQVAEALASLQEPQASSIWRTPFMATLLPNYSQSRAGASGTPGPQCGGDA